MNRRDLLKTTTGLATMLFLPTSTQAARLIVSKIKSSFNYYTQPQDTTNINTQLQPKIGLQFKNYYPSVIDATGNHTTPKSSGIAPKNLSFVTTQLEIENGVLKFGYSCRPNRELYRNPIPKDQWRYREDSANSRVYIVTKAEIKGATQEVEVVNHKNDVEYKLFAAPLEKTETGKALASYNKKPRGNKRNKLEKATDKAIRQIGGTTGTILKAIKWTTKKALEKRVAKDVAAIREKYGDEYRVYQMQFHQPNGNPFRHTVIGRETKILIDTEKEVGKKVFIEIPQISFTRDIQGITWMSRINGLSYKVTIPKLDN